MGLWSDIKRTAKKAWKAVKKAAKAVARAVSNVAHAFMSIVRRIVKIFDFIGSLLGIRPRKRMMLRILILTDAQGQPVVPQKEVERWVAVAKQVFIDKCNVELVNATLSEKAKKKYIEDNIPLSTTFPFVEIYDQIAPNDALTFHVSATSAWNGELDFFKTLLTGDYAAPIVKGFIIQHLPGDSGGFAWGMITDIFIADPEARSTVVAHETSHLCWLFHRKKLRNLMNPDREDMESNLTRWQISAIRSSKYAIYGS